ncbi:hypothetical protein IMSHALPRED_006629 [Imshaugia aleurites]|uniref:non-specific serine/threonine protein kinase n=1 Tax=Imshaugia aleurites TaxID=172621 RepID=A0A8H3EMG3_9LECA|nr:hypothetical protein IMSHALPRED_006629 [Imshaugia aleurites]
MTRNFTSAHKPAISRGEIYNVGLEGLRTYQSYDVKRDGPFYPCNVHAEPLTLYRSGGYHPVHLGGTIQEGRYIIVHKLGWELDGTIWLARDRKSSRDVAIKFLVSDRDKKSGEGIILKRLADGPVEYPGKRHIVELSDSFEITGPNGRHQCLVTEALGPWLQPGLLSPGESWKVARQLVEATVYMHSMNIVHGKRALYDEPFEHKDELVDDWIDAFGDLPPEWKNHTPPGRDDSPPYGDWGVIDMLQSTVDGLRPGDLWFSKPSLDTFGDLIISMTQYRPVDRPSASEVLRHPWFQRSPALTYAPGEILRTSSKSSP